MAACKKVPEVNKEYVDVERDLITVGPTTATIQCDYEYIATLKKAFLYYGEGEDAVDMNVAEMSVVQKTLYVELGGLKGNTTYSYYYEFVNGFNSMKSAVKAFKTETSSTTVTLPTVVTAEVTEITTNSAKGGGEVTNDGGAEVTERGICWSTNANPTLNDSHVAAGAGTGVFTATMNGLEANTTYHVRAYAINEKGTAYGLDKEFATVGGGGSGVPEGAIDGLFSVSPTQKVYFSQGNLQYQASTNTWRFAEHQWDFVGSEVVHQGEPGGTVTGSSNHLVSEAYEGWIDLFAFGTSGYNHGAVCYQPWATSSNKSDYYPYGSPSYNLYDQTGQADWGCNSISNGGNAPNKWRTLKKEEMLYLLYSRNTEVSFVRAMVNGIKGMLLFPDDWDVSTYQLNSQNEGDVPYDVNEITLSVWCDVLEPSGVAFFPAAGLRQGSDVFVVNSWGQYTLSSVFDEMHVFRFGFNEGINSSGVDYGSYRNNANSVRLVRDVNEAIFPPAVITSDVSNVTSCSATCGGEVTSDGGSDVTERGICWSTSANPTIDDNHVSAGSGVGAFTAKINGLEANTTYHVRAYAANEAGTAYGQDVEFTTLEGGGSGEHEWVDLGLPSGTLWATCNVGANAPEEYGDYFSWGETQTKSTYDWSTYRYCNGYLDQLTKYCSNSSYGYNGFTDTLTVLLPEDDAATAWGSGWCTPTEAQWMELYQNTTNIWTTQNGVNGSLFTSANGATLFLPAAGSRGINEHYYAGIVGEYWSSALHTDYTCSAGYFGFTSDHYGMFGSNRNLGLSIRAVRSSRQN